MDTVSLSERIGRHSPQPKGNQGFQPSKFIKTLILIQRKGNFHLDDIRHLQNNEAIQSRRSSIWGFRNNTCPLVVLTGSGRAQFN